jgi:hypothetical protein
MEFGIIIKIDPDIPWKMKSLSIPLPPIFIVTKQPKQPKQPKVATS